MRFQVLIRFEEVGEAISPSFGQLGGCSRGSRQESNRQRRARFLWKLGCIFRVFFKCFQCRRWLQIYKGDCSRFAEE